MTQEAMHRRLEEVVAELRGDGWLVQLEPRGQALPPGLRSLQPDFVATRADELLVGEITSRTTAAKERVDEIAGLVSLLPNARFVVYWLGDTPEEAPRVAGILKNIERAPAVYAVSSAAGLLLAWAALEAAIARFAVGKSVDARLRMPRQQLSELYSLGYISEADHERLVALWRTRSEIAHRGDSTDPKREDVDFVLKIARRMATERYVSVDQMVEWYLLDYRKLIQPTASTTVPLLRPSEEAVQQVLSARFPEATIEDVALAVSLVREQFERSMPG
jgi:hypothetical protein